MWTGFEPSPGIVWYLVRAATINSISWRYPHLIWLALLGSRSLFVCSKKHNQFLRNLGTLEPWGLLSVKYDSITPTCINKSTPRALYHSSPCKISSKQKEEESWSLILDCLLSIPILQTTTTTTTTTEVATVFTRLTHFSRRKILQNP